MENRYFYEGPIGRYCLCESASQLTRLWLGNRLPFIPVETKTKETAILKEAYRQLNAYFEGKLKEFDLPYSLTGTPFQLRIWSGLQKIPYGTTITYGELATMSGNSNASRAVGMANSRNPLPIFIPCHRVIGSGRKLTGYTGGLDIKQKLLQIEGITLF